MDNLQQEPQQVESQQFQPTYDANRTRYFIKQYKDNPALYSSNLDTIRAHAQYHNIPFYEGDFSLVDAVKQAAGGFFEGFTTLRISDHPDNEYEAVARNIGHLAGFVPGLMSGPLKALGLTGMANAAKGLKSIPMLGADAVTKTAKSFIKPAIKASKGGRFGAVNIATDFLMGDKARHITEGAFHLGVASSISSVWDGVDTMMDSFFHGAIAGGVFRTIGNIIPGNKGADKFARGLSGSLFMGLPSTMRGATTPEQIYEYLMGAYFGGKEMPWYKARAIKYLKKGDKQIREDKDIKLEIERDPELIKGFKEEPEIVQKEVKKIFKDGIGDFEGYGDPAKLSGNAHLLMGKFGILDQIPSDKTTTEGYKTLHKVLKGRQSKTRKQAHGAIHIATSGTSRIDNAWSEIVENYGVPVVRYVTPKESHRFTTKRGTKGIQRDLSEKELYSKAHLIDRANKTLQRKIGKLDNRNYEAILSNVHQVDKVKSVFAIGEIETSQTGTKAHLNGKTVKGKPGWAIQVALDRGVRNINVFDKGTDSWYKWNSGASRFKPTLETPKLTRNPALIGHTDKLTIREKQAMQEVAEITFGDKPTPISKVKGAIPQEKVEQWHPKTEENIRVISEAIKSTTEQITDINKALKSGKPDAVQVKKYKKELIN